MARRLKKKLKEAWLEWVICLHQKTAKASLLILTFLYTLCFHLPKQKQSDLLQNVGLDRNQVFEKISMKQPEEFLTKMPGFIFVSSSLEGTVTWSASGHNTKWLSEYFKQKHQIFPLKLMALFVDRQRFCSNQKKRIFTRKWSYSLQSGN